VIIANRFPAILACGLILVFGRCEAQQSAPVTIPVEVTSGLVYMQGQVNQSGPLNVVLDTGSSFSIVDPSLAQTAGLTSSQSVEAAGMGKGASQTVHLFEDSELQWGNPTNPLQLLHQKGAMLPIHYISEQVGKRTDAIFGSNLFLNYTIAVDYQQQRATFTSTDSETRPSGTAIPIEIFGNVPFVEVTIQGDDGEKVSGRFVADSGTAGAMILSKKFLEAHPRLIDKTHFANAPTVTAIGGEIHAQRIQIQEVGVGPFVFSKVIANVPDASVGILSNDSIAGTIGAGFFRRFTITWDYARKQMFLAPNNALKDPFETDSSGLHLVSSGPSYETSVVGSVLPGSPAALAGLSPGDQIIAIDGTKGLPLWEMAKIFGEAGRSVELTVQRKSNVLQVKLLLRNPFQNAN
jgi:predicted aspartyl protease